MSHPTRIARILLASVAVGAVSLVALAGPASAWPIREGYLKVTPNIGQAGSMLQVMGLKFLPGEDVVVTFWDRNGGAIVGEAPTNQLGYFELTVCVPWNATPGADKLVAESTDKKIEASATFTTLGPRPSYHSPRPASRGGRDGEGDSICV